MAKRRRTTKGVKIARIARKACNSLDASERGALTEQAFEAIGRGDQNKKTAALVSAVTGTPIPRAEDLLSSPEALAELAKARGAGKAKRARK